MEEVVINQPLPIVLLLFTGSLLIVMVASAWFTRRLESICDVLDLPPSLLSLLGALGANIPNYAASTVAIAGGHLDVGLGIIIGSNIYNIAIILSIATFATPKRHGIALTVKERQDVRIVAGYTLAIMLTILLGMWLLPGTPLVIGLHMPLLASILLIVAAVLTLSLFAALAFHALTSRGGGRGGEDEENQSTTKDTYNAAILRWIGEGLLALIIALGGVVVMVQSGQALAIDLRISQVLAGLLILAVATSLPNTVVAFGLARTDRETACVEEIFSSNSINASLGIALPLLFWHDMLYDRLLLLLDTPLMVLLTLAALFLVFRRRVSRTAALLLLLVYGAWVVVHVFL